MGGSKRYGELVNCSFCGRDTYAVSGICGKCMGSYNPHTSDEHRGRHARSTQVIGGSSIKDVDPEESPDQLTASEEYNGPSIRDDL